MEAQGCSNGSEGSASKGSLMDGRATTFSPRSLGSFAWHSLQSVWTSSASRKSLLWPRALRKLQDISAHARFEASAALSLAKLVRGRPDLGGFHDPVIDKFYVLTATKPTIVQSIRQSLDEWINQPTREHLASLMMAIEKLRGRGVSGQD